MKIMCYQCKGPIALFDKKRNLVKKVELLLVLGDGGTLIEAKFHPDCKAAFVRKYPYQIVSEISEAV